MFSQFSLTPVTASSIIVTIMIPIRSTIKTETTPYVNYGLLAVNILVFAYAFFLQGEALEAFYRTHGIIPSKIISLEAYGFLDRTAKYFSSMFIHESWLHIGGNMIFLYIFGNAIENLLGHARYILFYLLCGLVAVFVHVLLNSHSAIPVIGASGAISGILGIYILFFPRSKILTLLVVLVFVYFVRIRAYLFIIFWFAIQFLAEIGYIGDAGAEGLWAHLAGFICGIAAGRGFFYTRQNNYEKYRSAQQTEW